MNALVAMIRDEIERQRRAALDAAPAEVLRALWDSLPPDGGPALFGSLVVDCDDIYWAMARRGDAGYCDI